MPESDPSVNRLRQAYLDDELIHESREMPKQQINNIVIANLNMPLRHSSAADFYGSSQTFEFKRQISPRVVAPSVPEVVARPPSLHTPSQSPAHNSCRNSNKK